MTIRSSLLSSPKQSEHELLLSCINADRNAGSNERIRALVTSETDWEYLFLFARRHSVLPLFYVRLHEVAPDLIPHTTAQRLATYCAENTARNILLSAELCRLIELLDSTGVEAIPYKGPALAVFAYDNLALRRFVDLDVMVRSEDVVTAIDQLLGAGYEFAKPLTEAQQNVLFRTQHNIQFRGNNGRVIVELHWQVAPHLFASSVTAEELWQKLIAIEVNGTSLKTLAAEDLLFSLCVHGSRHLWDRLLWICDVAWIVERYELNWPALIERAQRTRTERMFLLGLDLCRKLLNTRFPHRVERELTADDQLSRLSSDVIDGLFGHVEHVPATATQILRYNLRVRRSWSSRFRYVGQAFKPTDLDVAIITFPSVFSFGYYLMRPLRLLKQRVDRTRAGKTISHSK